MFTLVHIRALFLALALAFFALPAPAQDLFTREDILRVSPRANSSLVNALVNNQAQLAERGINSRLRAAHFVSQILLETGGLRHLEENMNYSAERLIEVFSRRTISVKKAHEIEYQPRIIANWVYGGRPDLGNRGRDTEDGWNYRGSGYIQLTGRSNFLRRGEEIGLPLAEDPELARDPSGGLSAATAYWQARNINDAADINDRYRVRILVNGPAANGYPHGVAWFNKVWRQIYQDMEPFGPELEAVEEADIALSETEAIAPLLQDLGLLRRPGIEDGQPDATMDDLLSEDEFEEAIRAFQESRELDSTGVLNDDTFYALTDPQEWRRLPEEDMAALTPDPETGSSFSFVETAVETGDAPIDANETELELGLLPEPEGFTPDEEIILAESSAVYAEYELVDGDIDASGGFIPHTVIGEDNRVSVEEFYDDHRDFPSRAIVQILLRKTATSKYGLCSGALIAPNLVLTAGHCVHGGTRGGRWYHEFQVYPGRLRGTLPFGRCGVEKVFALNGWTNATSRSTARFYDLGAIKLDCEVGNTVGWLGVRPLENSEATRDTVVQGYAGDREFGVQFVSQDRIRVLQQLKAFYRNDTFGGTSGSPVFEVDENMIYCVHTNGRHNGSPWRQHNACTRITPERLSTIIGWLDQ